MIKNKRHTSYSFSSEENALGGKAYYVPEFFKQDKSQSTKNFGNMASKTTNGTSLKNGAGPINNPIPVTSPSLPKGGNSNGS